MFLTLFEVGYTPKAGFFERFQVKWTPVHPRKRDHEDGSTTERGTM
jgi:hypothetical protein